MIIIIVYLLISTFPCIKNVGRIRISINNFRKRKERLIVRLLFDRDDLDMHKRRLFREDGTIRQKKEKTIHFVFHVF